MTAALLPPYLSELGVSTHGPFLFLIQVLVKVSLSLTADPESRKSTIAASAQP